VNINTEALQKLQSYLNIAQKAGKVVFGADTVQNWRKKMYGILLCGGASENTASKMRAVAAEREIDVVMLPTLTNPDSTKISLSKLDHRENTKVIALTNKNLYTIIQSLVKEVFAVTF